MTPANDWSREYNLVEARRHPSSRKPAAHQAEALAKLGAWYTSAPSPAAGGLLVLPTGGGKTFSAIRFLCQHPLSDGYKVLWLAHTHHLLEQALDGFGRRDDGEAEVGHIHEPREWLRARVVSGTPGHSRIAEVKPTDDVLICTLQTAVKAYREEHAALRGFLDSAKGKLLVVFDEAHHAPAPSYTSFLVELRKEAPALKLLGLTATPMYIDKQRAGWLEKLFPQKILYQVSPNKLIAAGILAKPIPIPCETKFQARFDEALVERWRASYKDVPEEIVTALATNQGRNDAIWRTYVDQREKFGKTLIFADRWYQCDYLREKLRANGVRADVVYSHVDADPGSVEARNRRTRDENDKVLHAFRKGELDVLLNVRMLTEGTDVPSVQSVFLTRQTTSPILLRQMVGRALRGPKFGGTETANIVLFMDEWREAIRWAEFDDVWGDKAGDGRAELRKHTPLPLISIELVRRLANQMESGEPAAPSFLQLLPIGWYVPEFDTELAGSDDAEHRSEMVLVHEDERAAFAGFLEEMAKRDLAAFADPGVRLESVAQELEALIASSFPAALRTNRTAREFFHLLRHLAQSGGALPPFFSFEEREKHDLMPDVRLAVDGDWGPAATRAHLEARYSDRTLFWRSLYTRFELFRDQFRHLVDSEIERRTGASTLRAPASIVAPPQRLVESEPAEEVKREVIERDGKHCLCCGRTGKALQVDHIVPRYRGGTNDASNLQTLCKDCNRIKAVQEMHFRNEATLLKAAPQLPRPEGYASSDLDELSCDVRRTIQMFYACAAVRKLDFARKGTRRYEWEIQLCSGNPPAWLAPHLETLLGWMRGAQAGDRSGPVRSLTLTSTDAPDAPIRVWTDLTGGRRSLKASELHARQAVSVYRPSDKSLPNAFLAGKVVRVNEAKRTADVSVTIGRSDRVLMAVPAKAIFEPGAGDE